MAALTSDNQVVGKVFLDFERLSRVSLENEVRVLRKWR
jgi:hypothetical protein